MGQKCKADFSVAEGNTRPHRVKSDSVGCPIGASLVVRAAFGLINLIKRHSLENKGGDLTFAQNSHEQTGSVGLHPH